MNTRKQLCISCAIVLAAFGIIAGGLVIFMGTTFLYKSGVVTLKVCIQKECLYTVKSDQDCIVKTSEIYTVNDTVYIEKRMNSTCTLYKQSDFDKYSSLVIFPVGVFSLFLLIVYVVYRFCKRRVKVTDFSYRTFDDTSTDEVSIDDVEKGVSNGKKEEKG